jgi:uncharacterized membrane protein
MNINKKFSGQSTQTLKQTIDYFLALGTLTVTATVLGVIWGWLISLIGIPTVAGYIGAACGFTIITVSSVNYEVGRIVNVNLEVINKNIQALAVLVSNMTNFLLLNESKVVEEATQVKPKDGIVH